MLHDLPTADQDPDDPVTFINTNMKVAFQEMCRQASFDMLMGKATQPYDDGRVHPGDDILTINELRPFLGIQGLDTSLPCTTQTLTTNTVITTGTHITSKARQSAVGWPGDDVIVCLSTPSWVECSTDIVMLAGLVSLTI
jgi:hypothetical protein